MISIPRDLEVRGAEATTQPPKFLLCPEMTSVRVIEQCCFNSVLDPFNAQPIVLRYSGHAM